MERSISSKADITSSNSTTPFEPLMTFDIALLETRKLTLISLIGMINLKGSYLHSITWTQKIKYISFYNDIENTNYNTVISQNKLQKTQTTKATIFKYFSFETLNSLCNTNFYFDFYFLAKGSGEGHTFPFSNRDSKVHYVDWSIISQIECSMVNNKGWIIPLAVFQISSSHTLVFYAKHSY